VAASKAWAHRKSSRPVDSPRESRYRLRDGGAKAPDTRAHVYGTWPVSSGNSGLRLGEGYPASVNLGIECARLRGHMVSQRRNNDVSGLVGNEGGDCAMAVGQSA
jgi:hypothetical protein